MRNNTQKNIENKKAQNIKNRKQKYETKNIINHQSSK